MGDALLPEHYAFIWDMWRQWSLNLRPLLNWTTPSPSVSIYPGIRSIGGRIIEINLQDGDIGAIPPSIGSLVTLRVLDLSKNVLDTVPPEVGKLSSLENWDLSNNLLSRIPPELGQLSCLRILNLSYNSLTAIPAEFGNLASLQQLFLSNNELVSIPEELGRAPSLQVIYLNHNNLTRLPPSLATAPFLTLLDVSYNCMIDVSQWQSVPAVKGLLVQKKSEAALTEHLRADLASAAPLFTPSSEPVPARLPKVRFMDYDSSPDTSPRVELSLAPETMPGSGSEGFLSRASPRASLYASESFQAGSPSPDINDELPMIDLAEPIIPEPAPQQSYAQQKQASEKKRPTQPLSVATSPLAPYSFDDDDTSETLAIPLSGSPLSDGPLPLAEPAFQPTKPLLHTFQDDTSSPHAALLSQGWRLNSDSNTRNVMIPALLQTEGRVLPSQAHTQMSDTPATASPASLFTTLATSSTAPSLLSTIDLKEVRKLDKIGQGAFGSVWKAVWRGQDVALKTLKLEDATAAQEILIMQNVHHTNLMILMGVAFDEKKIYLMMEYMEKGSLYHLLQQPAFDLTWEKRRLIALDIAKGMNFLHFKSIVHRDLKSCNLLVDETGKVKVADFGLGKLVSSGGAGQMKSRVGTMLWMAPEVIKGEPYGKPADVYSFGIVLWELATRLVPYADKDQYAVMFGVSVQGLRPDIPATVPQAWATLMKKCWDQDALLRPTFEEILVSLKDMKL